MSIYTIGHSNHSLQRFSDLLREHGVEVLVDVRSVPRSRFCPHFDREPLQARLEAAGVRYLFLGDELGGRPTKDAFYDTEGHVLYGRLASSPSFSDAVSRLLTDAERFRVALMCSEENPADCHRHLLVGRVLVERGVAVQHIRGDGRVQPYEEVDAAKSGSGNRVNQLELFHHEEQDTWKSIRSVLRRKRPANSSAR